MFSRGYDAVLGAWGVVCVGLGWGRAKKRAVDRRLGCGRP